MGKLGILGATGKMGQAIYKLAQDSSWQPVCVPKHSPWGELDIAIDFSHADACNRHLLLAQEHKTPIVIGTTGLCEKDHESMQKASKEIPILYSANFSIGIALMKKFLHTYAAIFQSGYIDLFETHHTTKKDIPSGTALALAHLFTGKNIHRSCPRQRTVDDLVIHAQRIPNHHGEHKVQCSFQEETMLLQHTVHDRMVYAKGALLAASFLLNKPPRLYEFSEALSLPQTSQDTQEAGPAEAAAAPAQP